MKTVYPVVFTKLDSGFMAYVPDMEINTQGENLPEAIAMARDAIGIMGIDMEDEQRKIPTPSAMSEVAHNKDELVSMVDIDFAIYRRAHESRVVRKNVTIPSWLNVQAEDAGLNFSQELQEALKVKLRA